MTVRAGEIAVAVHDVEPATFQRCALIRDWLADHGVERVTLLVIPAPDLHPLDDRSPDLTRWLAERRMAGDAIAQHGLHHRRLGPSSGGRPVIGRIRGPRAEFIGLDAEETRRAVAAGHRLLHLAGVEPRGFVAPGYAYTAALRSALAQRFEWWGGALGIHRADGRIARAPALRAGAAARGLSGAVVTVEGALAGPLLRLDVHPSDVQHPRHMRAMERLLLGAAGKRRSVTYDELALAAAPR